ncbi:MAG: DJ-1/PfpI family protein [Candidatus Thorarchaeota archaeon]
MKKVLCFIYDGFADFEITLACRPFYHSEDYNIVYIAYENSPIISWGGLTIKPDKKVSDVSPTNNIEGIIFPGGNGRIVKPELTKLVKELNEEKKMLAAICAGPEFIAKMGLLNGVKYTTSETPEMYEENKELDPFPRDTFIEKRIIQDGNIITAQGYAFTDFALKIWEYFDLYDNDEEKEELKILYTPD